ncbi:uncharacterized protein LOC129708808 isoform X2 [Leucoraja erinacea]|uniref:uncharacterized protein LOC129708808 isoform X2 n=1 Tax=Leucoraja erinaceus TaxID=7782 RepID=UPI002458D33B|nr:uncharacterized protein LOC129708808 isoform X2 [Leucoraja erinacea]
MDSVPEGSVMSQFDSSENVLNVNLSVLEPRRVVEVYVKRSITLAEADVKTKKMKWRSLPENASPRNMKFKGGSGLSRRGKNRRAQGRQQTERENQNHRDKVVPSGSNSSNVDLCVEEAPSNGKSNEGSKWEKIQTFFGRFANFLWRRKGDEKKDDGQNEVKEAGPHQAENPPECNGQQHFANKKEPPGEMSPSHKLREKSSRWRVFSLKKNNSKVKDIESESSKRTEVQPNVQDLKGGRKLGHKEPERVSEDPSDQVSEDVKVTLESNEEKEHLSEDPSDQVSEDVKQTLESNEENDNKQEDKTTEVLEAQSLDVSEQDTEYLYEQVSEEVEWIVRTLESNEENIEKRKSRAAEILEAHNLDESDDGTWKIIQLLQIIGDGVELQLQDNSQLSTFFTNISYNAFKELADQYIQEEVKNTGQEENMEIMQLAFTLDFTAKVAGTCLHQIKRITGFGSQYLQETCWHLLGFSDQQETV